MHIFIVDRITGLNCNMEPQGDFFI